MPVFRLTKEIAFPHPSHAEESGLLAVGGGLEPERLALAYQQGIFPWYSEGEPILWFSPDPRMTLQVNDFKASKSLQRTIASQIFEVRRDTQFRAVIERCSRAPRPGQDGTWITTEMKEAYSELHRQGLAHSFETYRQGELVGGLYGVSLGRAFFGESMFHQERDASKVAFAALVAFCQQHRFDFIDAQQPTKHLASLGAKSVPRESFLQQLLASQTRPTLRGPWTEL